MKKVHGMLDLETLSVNVHYHPVVLSIGIATTSELTYYAELPTAAQVGRHRSLATLAWWEAQADNLPERCAALDRSTLKLQLEACALVLSKVDYLWSNGADFDIPILQDLFAENRVHWPLKYNAPRCFRTMYASVKKAYPNFVPSPVSHNALDDAQQQLDILTNYCDVSQFEN